MLLKLFTFNCFLLVSVSLMTGEASAQVKSDLLNTPIEKFWIEGVTLQSALSKLSATYDIPIGLEIDTTSQNEPNKPIKLDIEQSSLETVLSLIVDNAPNYQWAMIGGVINVFPRSSRDEILSTNIKSLKFRNGSIYDFRKKLSRIPEVSQKAKELKVRFTTLAFSTSDFSVPTVNFGLDVENVSLQAVLNIVILKSRAKFWVSSRLGNQNELFVINFS